MNLTISASLHSQVTRSLCIEHSQSSAIMGSVAVENLLGLSLRNLVSLSTGGRVVVVAVEVVVVHSGSPKIVPSCSSVASAWPSSVASGHCCCCCWDHGGEASVGFSIDEHRKKDLKELDNLVHKPLTKESSVHH